MAMRKLALTVRAFSLYEPRKLPHEVDGLLHNDDAEVVQILDRTVGLERRQEPSGRHRLLLLPDREATLRADPRTAGIGFGGER